MVLNRTSLIPDALVFSISDISSLDFSARRTRKLDMGRRMFHPSLPANWCNPSRVYILRWSATSSSIPQCASDAGTKPNMSPSFVNNSADLFMNLFSRSSGQYSHLCSLNEDFIIGFSQLNSHQLTSAPESESQKAPVDMAPEWRAAGWQAT